MRNLLKSHKFLCIALIIFILLDCVFTYIGLTHANGTEINPIMSALIEHSWATFFIVKMFFVSGAVYALYRLRNLKALTILACAYGLLVLYYIYCLSRIFIFS